MFWKQLGSKNRTIVKPKQAYKISAKIADDLTIAKRNHAQNIGSPKKQPTLNPETLI